MKFYKRLLIKLGSLTNGRIRVALYRKAGMKIGSNVRIASGIHVDRPEGVIIGDNCFINHFVHFHNGANHETTISIGNNVFLGPEVTFICATHEIGDHYRRAGKNKYGSINVEDGAWIGASTTILPGVRISQGGVIGAGAVVTKSTDPDALYYGVPARKIRELELNVK